MRILILPYKLPNKYFQEALTDLNHNKCVATQGILAIMSWRKTTVFIVLFLGYTAYSGWVYTYGTQQRKSVRFTNQQFAGKALWQKNNCTACHQLYGLGGYLGPDLTTIISDNKRGKLYATAFLKTGGTTMPGFHFNNKEIDALISYLAYVDASVKNNDNIEP